MPARRKPRLQVLPPFLVLALLICLAPGAAFCQQAEVEALGDRLVAHLRKERAQGRERIRLALFGCTRSDGVRTELSIGIAEAVGEVIRKHPEFEIIPRRQMDTVRERANFSKADLTQRDVAFAMADLAGANFAITGIYSRKGDQAQVAMTVFSLPQAKRTASFKTTLPLLEDWKKQDAVELPLPSEESPVSAIELDAKAAASGISFPGKGGVTFPECRSCPDPKFTDEARSAAFPGHAVVLLWTVIGEDGLVKDVRVVKSQPFGLTRQAIESVRRWTFKPATKDGKPVPVVTYVQVTFRLLR